jgi:hypothetical protein
MNSCYIVTMIVNIDITGAPCVHQHVLVPHGENWNPQMNVVKYVIIELFFKSEKENLMITRVETAY